MPDLPCAPEARRRRFAWLACLLVGGTLVASRDPEADPDDAWDLAAPRPAVALQPERLAFLDGLACVRCHAEVVDEWALTAHAVSGVDEVYRDALGDRKRPELCHGCHPPKPVLAGGGAVAQALLARAERMHLGVDCESCHLGPGGVLLGPRGTPTDAHPSARSAAFGGADADALCASCHATNIGPVTGVAADFLASGQAARGRSCVGCHMAPVERRWAHDPDAPEDAAPLRVGRSHLVQTPRDPSFAARAFAAALERGDDGDRVVLRNQAGHRVPGLSGRVFAFRAEVRDDAGAVLEVVELAFDSQRYLPVDGSAELPLTHRGASVRLLGLHTDPRAVDPVPFLELALGTDGR
jgi:hypothetical protein